MTNPITGELLEAINAFKRFAPHRPGNEISFFRYLAEDVKRHKIACADTAVWGVVADSLEALNNYNPAKLEQVRQVLGKVSEIDQITYTSWDGVWQDPKKLGPLIEELKNIYKTLDPEIKAWALREGE